MRNVAPVPLTSLETKDVDCEERAQVAWDIFVETRLSPVQGPSDATTCARIEQEVATDLALERGTAALWLQGKGFERTRRKVGGRNDYFYRFCFTVNGVKSATSRFVLLVSRDTSQPR